MIAGWRIPFFGVCLPKGRSLLTRRAVPSILFCAVPLYHRVYSPGQLQFITTSTYRRTPLFLSERFRRCFVQRLEEVWHYRLWQRRFYPFNVFSEEKFKQKRVAEVGAFCPPLRRSKSTKVSAGQSFRRNSSRVTSSPGRTSSRQRT